MPSYEASAIANEFVDCFGHRLDQMKLQKLSYIANGWNLAINNEPLIREIPEAWDNGPVYRSIWDNIKDYGLSDDHKILNCRGEEIAAKLSKNEAEILDQVCERYGGMSGTELSMMTHEPYTPWFVAYFDHGRNAAIMHDQTKDYFRKLALAGREQSRMETEPAA